MLATRGRLGHRGPGDTVGCAPLGCLLDPGQPHKTGPSTRTAPSFLRGIERRHTSHKQFEEDLSSCVSNKSAIKSLQETRTILYGHFKKSRARWKEETQRTINMVSHFFLLPSFVLSFILIIKNKLQRIHMYIYQNFHSS